MARASDFSIGGGDINGSMITIHSTAIPHSIRLGPNVTIFTIAAPCAGLSRRRSWIWRIIAGASHFHPAVLVPRVCPVHIVFPGRGQLLWANPDPLLRTPPKSLPGSGPIIHTLGSAR